MFRFSKQSKPFTDELQLADSKSDGLTTTLQVNNTVYHVTDCPAYKARGTPHVTRTISLIWKIVMHKIRTELNPQLIAYMAQVMNITFLTINFENNGL